VVAGIGPTIGLRDRDSRREIRRPARPAGCAEQAFLEKSAFFGEEDPLGEEAFLEKRPWGKRS
jgi:hypothetical protein